MIQEGDQEHMAACFLMENISSTTSHRAELEGAFHLCQRIKQCGMELTEVEQLCDNLRAAHSTNEKIWRLKVMDKTEADIILAIHQLKKELPNVKDCKYVYAHQDTRRSKKMTEAKQKKEIMTIEYEIEQITTHANLETDYSTSDDGTTYLT